LLPRASAYPRPTIKTVRREGVHFKLDISDVMQWQVFANVNPTLCHSTYPYLRNNCVIVDVGANCGEYCLKVAQHVYKKGFDKVRIYAFEPNPFILARLEDNLSLNAHLRPIINIVPMALSDTVGVADFTFSPSHTGAGKLGFSKLEECVKVDITRLDDFVESNFLQNITFIKIDVEGFEANVLSGARSTIEKNLPACYVEVTDKWLKRNGFSKEFIYDYFQQLNFHIMVDEGNLMEPLKTTSNNLLNQHNILCYK
jgi:FkbM family methyltransferase